MKLEHSLKQKPMR